MTALRSISGIVIGFLFARTLNKAFVGYWYLAEGIGRTPFLVPLTLVFVVATGAISGYVTGRVAGRERATIAALGVAGLLTGSSALALIDAEAAAPTWHTLLVLLVAVPLIPLGARRLVPDTSEWDRPRTEAGADAGG